MKTLKRFSLAPIFIFFILAFPSCDYAPDFGDDFGDVGCLGCGEDWEINTLDEANRELTNHTWKITTINVANDNTEFYNYKLVFKTDKTVTATYDTVTFNGTWSVTDNNPNQKLISDLKLKLVFTSPSIFTQISKEWTLISSTVSLFNYNEGDLLEFAYISNNVTSYSFKLQAIN